jgi:hypothetical protein
MSMTAPPLLVEMVELVEIWLVVLNVCVRSVGKEGNARKMKQNVMNLLVKIMLFVWICFKITSVLVHLEPMENDAKLLPRDALETPV